MYTIKLGYTDDKELSVPVNDERLDEFYSCLKNQKVFWFDKEESGFWTDYEKIRYVQLFRTKEDGSLEKVEGEVKDEETPQE